MRLFGLELKWNGFDIWHSGNDGAGSGLDADSVDGKHSSAFAPSGYGLGVPLSGVVISNSNNATATGMYYASSADPNKPAGVTDGALFVMAYSAVWINQLYLDWRTNKSYRRMCTNGVWSAWSTVWSSVSQGATSGLDADLLDGLHASAFAAASHTHTKSQITDMPTNLSQFVNDIGAGSGIKITVDPAAPSSPSPGDFWYQTV